MCALGIQWLASIFHPQRFAFDLKAETRRFYREVLGIELADADVALILGATPASHDHH